MYTLHCFAQSGNAFKVAFLLRALGVPWRAQHVDFFSGLARTPAFRERMNEMGELPVLDVGDRRLTQSGAILTWLAERHGRFGGRDGDERIEVLRWLLFDNHKFTSNFSTRRFLRCFGPAAPDPAVMTFLEGRMLAAYDVVEKHLAGREWIVGAAPTIADFSLSGYVFYPVEESGLDIAARYPAIDAWRSRLRALPGWGDPYEVLPGERIAPRWVA